MKAMKSDEDEKSARQLSQEKKPHENDLTDGDQQEDSLQNGDFVRGDGRVGRLRGGGSSTIGEQVPRQAGSTAFAGATEARE